TATVEEIELVATPRRVLVVGLLTEIQLPAVWSVARTMVPPAPTARSWEPICVTAWSALPEALARRTNPVAAGVEERHALPSSATTTKKPSAAASAAV